MAANPRREPYRGNGVVEVPQGPDAERYGRREALDRLARAFGAAVVVTSPPLRALANYVQTASGLSVPAAYAQGVVPVPPRIINSFDRTLEANRRGTHKGPVGEDTRGTEEHVENGRISIVAPHDMRILDTYSERCEPGKVGYGAGLIGELGDGKDGFGWKFEVLHLGKTEARNGMTVKRGQQIGYDDNGLNCETHPHVAAITDVTILRLVDGRGILRQVDRDVWTDSKGNKIRPPFYVYVAPWDPRRYQREELTRRSVDHHLPESGNMKGNGYDGYDAEKDKTFKELSRKAGIWAGEFEKSIPRERRRAAAELARKFEIGPLDRETFYLTRTEKLLWLAYRGILEGSIDWLKANEKEGYIEKANLLAAAAPELTWYYKNPMLIRRAQGSS